MAIKNLRESLSHLANDSKELADAVAEAQHLGIDDAPLAMAGTESAS